MLTPTQPRQTPLGKKFTVPKNLTAKHNIPPTRRRPRIFVKKKNSDRLMDVRQNASNF